MSANDAHDLSGPQLSVSERSHVFLPVIRKMASQIDVQQAPEWALVGTLMADVQLCASLSPFAASIGDPESRNPFMFAVWSCPSAA